MAQEKPNRIVEMLLAWRASVPVWRQAFADWWSQVREEPILLWETPAIRYGVYGTGGLLLLWIITSLPGMFVSPLPPGAAEESNMADFHVVCSDPACGYHFIIHRDMGFRRFPVKCPECGQMTGEKAKRCHSDQCKGKWVAPVKGDDGISRCPVCNEFLP